MNSTGGGIQGRESIITADVEGARSQVRLVENRAIDTEPDER